MPDTAQPNLRPHQTYRKRIVAEGRRQLLVDLPEETIHVIDELKRQRGMKSRSQALFTLVEYGRKAAQQTT
jgi:hypothetical protein